MAPRDPHLPDRPERPGARAEDGGRTLERIALGVYVLVLVWVVLLKLHTDGFDDLLGRRSLNLVPFGGTGSGGLGSSEVAVNVLAFVPFGALLYLAARRRTLARLLLPVVGVSVAFEAVQYVVGIGATDVTDVLTNAAGGLLGAGIAWLALRLLGEGARRWLALAVVIVLAALAAGFLAWLQVTGVRFRL